MTTWNICIIAFVVTVAVADVRWHKIPRALTVPAFLIGLLFHWFEGDFRSALGAAALGLVIAIALFTLGAIGGGDVKLVSALGALLGFHDWAHAMEIAILTAAAISLIQVLRRRALLRTLRNMWQIIKDMFTIGFKEHPSINVQNPALIRAPFGVAAAVGTVATLIRL